ncbi:O-antigen translocase, partial [Bacteroidia bacterium]|nr:O-antigen translocase [Bacteroidia bacterium]
MLIHKLRNLLKSDFFKVSIWSGAAAVVRMGVNLAISKVLAIFVGPSGFALVGQLQNGLAIFRTISTGAISNGVTKYVAENGSDKEQQTTYIKAAIRITSICSVITSVLILVFARSISVYLFQQETYIDIVVFFGLGLSFFAFNGLFLAIVNGKKEFKKFIIASISGAFFTLLLTVLFVYAWGLYGALLAFAIAQSLVFFVTAFMIRANLKRWFSGFFSKAISKEHYTNLLKYALMVLTSALIVPFVQILIRNHIIDQVSLTDAGIWEGMNKISTTYLGLITLSLTTYYLPRISEIKDNLKVKSEVKKTLIAIFPIIVVSTIIIFLLRSFIIKLLFTAEFMPMESLFSVKLVGDIFKILSWVLSFVMLAKAMTKLFIATEIVFSGALYMLSIYLVNSLGLIGSVYAYT